MDIPLLYTDRKRLKVADPEEDGEPATNGF